MNEREISAGISDESAGNNSGGAGISTVSAHETEVTTKLDAMREQLQKLRQQQDELERQKGDLEDLRRKQDEYTHGKAEMLDNLTRALGTLEREELQAHRSVELCKNTSTAFKEYLERLHAIHDTEWSSANVRLELSHALGLIGDSRMEFNRARTKLECLDPAADQPAVPEPGQGEINWQEIGRYCRLGAAASAPLILAGTIWVILLLVFKR
jgi:DNA repair exonuclease SbcCD ATPase subunit